MPAARRRFAAVNRVFCEVFMFLIGWFHFYLRSLERRISENFRILAAAMVAGSEKAPRVRRARELPPKRRRLLGGRGGEALHDRLKAGILPQWIPERVLTEIAVGRKSHGIVSTRWPLDQGPQLGQRQIVVSGPRVNDRQIATRDHSGEIVPVERTHLTRALRFFQRLLGAPQPGVGNREKAQRHSVGRISCDILFHLGAGGPEGCPRPHVISLRTRGQCRQPRVGKKQRATTRERRRERA